MQAPCRIAKTTTRHFGDLPHIIFCDLIRAMLDTVDEIVDAFGGPTALGRKLAPFGKIEPNAISMWSARKAVPGKWHLPLLQIAETEGIALTPALLMRLSATDTAA